LSSSSGAAEHSRGGGLLLADEPAPGVARLTISNPDRRGALDHAILDAFAATMPRLDARCVIITGERDTFSAGYDLGGLPDEVLPEEADRLVAHPFASAIDAVEDYPYPTIAALNGHAIGGGLELALACDLRIAAGTIALGMPPAKLGLVYSHTGIRKFIDTIGAARTRELFLVGRRIDARTARSWGLVNAVAEEGRLAEEALELATEIAAGAPLAQRGNKRVIRAVLAAQSALDPDTERELLELRRASLSSQDFREGVHAFAEKRAPRWQGR
jgi:enoyl-CoA hydratase/carnithine racemase